MGMLFLLVSCEKEKEKDSASISDENFYKELGITIINCYVDVYNQNLAGKPTGNQNIIANGPMGGTVSITGTTTYDNTHGITTTELTFTMTNVNYTFTYGSGDNTWVTEVSLTGSATYSGSFSSNYTSLNHQSNNLYIKGSVTHDGITRNVDMSGNVSINRSSTTSVNIFGNKVSW